MFDTICQKSSEVLQKRTKTIAHAHMRNTELFLHAELSVPKSDSESGTFQYKQQ